MFAASDRAAPPPLRPNPSMKQSLKKAIGWREWVALPGLGAARVKAKVDTGARSSSLHAFNVEVFQRHGVDIVAFDVHPLQRSDRKKLRAEAPLVEMRTVRSSGGHVTLRPVIETEVELMGERWTIELTLAARDTMGFRMLLGRQAIQRGFVVDPGRSFLGGKPARGKKKKKKKSKKKKGLARGKEMDE